MTDHKRSIIAGPCALESREQLRCCVAELKKLGVSCVRASLWKPRTLPGWEGLGALGMQTLLEETIPHGLMPATEILTSDHAEIILDGLRAFGGNPEILLWIGARNQNHIELRRIAQLLAVGPSGITLMFKNQMWEDERHWLGIYGHLVEAGFPKERLSICHRGFAPGSAANPHQYRNPPHFEMAMRVKQKTKLPMIIDPSHIGGSTENVFRVIDEAKHYDFDGLMIEVHLDPASARTDQTQQLNIEQFKTLLPTERVA